MRQRYEDLQLVLRNGVARDLDLDRDESPIRLAAARADLWPTVTVTIALIVKYPSHGPRVDGHSPGRGQEPLADRCVLLPTFEPQWTRLPHHERPRRVSHDEVT